MPRPLRDVYAPHAAYVHHPRAIRALRCSRCTPGLIAPGEPVYWAHCYTCADCLCATCLPDVQRRSGAIVVAAATYARDRLTLPLTPHADPDPDQLRRPHRYIRQAAA